MKRTTLKRVGIYLKAYWLFLLLSLLCAAIATALTLYIPIVTGQAVDLMIAKGQVDFKSIAILLRKMVLVIIMTGIFQWIMNICNNHIAFKITKDLRSEAFKKLQILPLKYLDSHGHGELVSRIIADVEQFSEGLLMALTQLFTGILTILGTLGFMFFTSLPITLLVVVLTPMSLFLGSFIAKKTFSMFRVQSETRGEETSFIEEMVGNLKVVQAFLREEENKEHFYEIDSRLKKASFQATFFSSIANPGTRFVNSMVYMGVGLFGAFLVIGGGLTVGGLTCFLSYANQYTKPFNEISGVVTEFQNALACAKRILDFIDEKPQREEVKNAYEYINPKGKVDIEGVDFSYNDENPLIKDFHLSVKPGQSIAIVGPTGCGKSTIINLLMRFYDVDSGSIRVDDRDIYQASRKSLRKSYGMVLQETWLKSGSILKNLTLGREDASMEEVIAAAKASHAHSFIKRLPEGYHTILGEDAGDLSQGQKQLLCITRVMLSLPSMLILDEATSSIDTRTEQKIQEAFLKMMKGRTSFIVAHRLSTIQNADLILVMNKGNIIEQGNHQELLEKKGFYANLYESQFVG
ncbi:MAG TPA: ABC transporter ATP-binding protein [Lachnospiraceae bacterium]